MLFSAPSAIILIGTLIAAGGAFWAHHKQNQFEAELKAKQEAIELKNEEIIKLNRQLAALSIHTMNMVTGGESFAYLQFSIKNDANSMRLDKIFLQQEGIYPLYELRIQISDIDAMKDIKVFDVGTIGSIRHVKFFPLNEVINFDLTGKFSQRFNIFFYARNGMWFQQMIYKKLSSGWSIAMRVVRPDQNNEPVVLFESISSDFPIKSENIDWE